MRQAHRALLGKADLLRALALAERMASSGLESGERWARQLGFAAVEPVDAVEAGAKDPAIQAVPVGELPLDFSPAPAPEPTPQRPPLQTRLFALTRLEPEDQPAPSSTSPSEAAERLTVQDCQPRPAAKLPWQPLVRRTRLWPALQQSLRQDGPGSVDVLRWADRLARGHSVVVPPRLVVARWTGALRVLWDVSDRLYPYQQDFARMVAEVLRLRGAAGVQLVRFDGDGLHWPERHGGRPGQVAASTWLLSDLGMLATGHDDGIRRWLDWLQGPETDAASPSLVAWVPLVSRQVDPRLAVHAAIHCLHPTAAEQRVTRRRLAANRPSYSIEQARLDGLRDRLWCLASLCLRLEPALLRRLRLLEPVLAREPALEALIWADTERGGSSRVVRALQPAYAVEFRQRFEVLAPALQVAVLREIQAAHATRGRALESAELLLWKAHAQPAAIGQEGVAEAVVSAEQWFHRFERTLGEAASGRTPDAAAMAYAKDLLARAGQDTVFHQQQATWLAPVWALSGHDEVPRGLSSQQLAAVSGLRREGGVELQLMQAGSALELRRVPVRKGAGLGPVLDGVGVEVRWGEQRHWCDLRKDTRLVAAGSTQGEPVRVRQAGRRTLVVEALERPAWAVEWGRDSFGLYAELSIRSVDQRMRYIEPGTFLMGSPDTEPGRDSDEGPRHQVTLTEGYWLADTTCTQALWQAVMGSNPSNLSGNPDFPVTNVSWNEVQEFLTKLNSLLPSGCEAALLTEAQWEYTCRAGTKTPYWFGESISAEQAHFGQPSWNSYRPMLPVKARPANGWGLYQMHGNVWEWCAGSPRKYSVEAVENPPDDGQARNPRALRGGSGNSPVRDARSAARYQDHRDEGASGRGFRFSLRPVKPGQVKGSGGAAATGVSRPTELGKGASRRGARGKKK